MVARRVAVIAFNEVSPFHLAVPCVVFGDRHPGVPSFDFVVCAGEPGKLRTTAGFDITVTHGLEALDTAGTIIVPSWRDPDERPPAALVEALCRAHDRGAELVGLCLGAYVIAETGLLDGRSATTHWAYADDFGRRYPAIRVDPKVLYVDEGRVLTSAGTAAGIDCCLHLLRRRHGSACASRVARRLVVAPHRAGGQAQFIEQPLPAAGGASRLSELLGWIGERLDQVHTVDSLAARALMSRRTFTRRFRALTGTTVLQWLLAQRLALAQRLLEDTDHAVADVATLAGFGSSVTLRYQFGKRFSVSPSQWRRAFHVGNPPAMR